MSYDYVPASPHQQAAYEQVWTQQAPIADPIKNKAGFFLDDAKIENAITDVVMGNGAIGIANYGIESAKEAVCSPMQIQNFDETRRTTGIPITQGLVAGIEKISSFAMGRDVEMNTTMGVARAIDSIAKPIVTAGGSLLADSIYEAGVDAKDMATCLSEGKEIAVPYYGDEHYKPGAYPYDVQVTAQSTEPFNPYQGATAGNGYSEADLNEIRAMYDTKAAISPDGSANPNREVQPGANVDSAPEMRTPTNVKITPRPQQGMGGLSM